MNVNIKIKTILEYLPSIYNTRYSYIFTLYGVEVSLKSLRCNVINGGQLQQILVNESPHFRCALECFGNAIKINQLLYLNRSLIAGYLECNNLEQCRKYISYIENAHPDTDAIEAFQNFLKLFTKSLECGSERSCNYRVLVKRESDSNGENFWLLIDGLHRSSILLALNELRVSARVKFP